MTEDEHQKFTEEQEIGHEVLGVFAQTIGSIVLNTRAESFQAGQIETLRKVSEFHHKFNRPVNTLPHVTDTSINEMRIKLLQEELDELKEALANGDVVETLDALTDLQYVLDGSFLELGFWQFKTDAFNEVHASNMSKLGEDGKPVLRADGKVLKGPNFFEPNLKQFLKGN